jgi:hypothetical protein
MLGKGNFLLGKSVCNRQSNLTRLGITINRLNKLQSDLTSSKYVDQSRCSDITSNTNQLTKVKMSKVVRWLKLLVGL